MTKRFLYAIIIGSHVLAAYSVIPRSHPSARQPRQETPDTLTFAMVGDIMMGTTYPTTMLPPKGGAALFRDAAPILKQADIAMGNLEGTLCNDGKSAKKDQPNTYAFRTPTTYGQWLREAGFDFLSMANNHAHDFGDEGIASTELTLRQEGIRYAGLQGRTAYAVIKRKGLKIGFCAFGHNEYTLLHTQPSLTTVAHLLNSLRQQTDIIVVSFHGGAEGKAYTHLPDSMELFYGEKRGHLRRLAHFCVDHGADIVYGHGPHVVRATEVYKGRFIAYSLGNFCTPYGMSLSGISGQAPIIEIKTDRQGRFLRGRIYPMRQQKGQGPRHDPSDEVVRQLRRLTKEDVPGSEAYINRKGEIVPRHKSQKTAGQRSRRAFSIQ